jgi:hypothetical protein
LVQGGTFLNDSITRSAEIIFGRNVCRVCIYLFFFVSCFEQPNIAGHMGCFGASLIAIQIWKEKLENLKNNKNHIIKSTFLNFDQIKNMSFETTSKNCGKCNNNCQLTIHKFNHLKNIDSDIKNGLKY